MFVGDSNVLTAREEEAIDYMNASMKGAELLAAEIDRLARRQLGTMRNQSDGIHCSFIFSSSMLNSALCWL